MAEKPIVLKVLLRQRHLQGHTAFCKEYDKVAKRVDQELTGSWPSKAQFYRWLSGDLRGLPYAHHCRILESMFPDWKAEQLFQAHSGGIEFVPEPPPKLAQATIKVSTPPVEGPADISAVYTTRSEFMHQMPPHQLFDGAHKSLFLDPHGEFIKLREKEESHPDGVLSTLTTLNMQALQRLQARLSPEAHARLKIRTYDEVVRFNITIVDDITCVVQPYLPDARGVESPTLVLEKRDERGGLFDTFTQVFTSMWTRAQEVAE
ncbi:DUF5919 domain-containing protein [Kibdelosporangium lantanae]|uniref:DUF5919 domain-containing protein n=1 Tax=Kibdelosporangium lantanae TaxID=1497396 RepID=A0ABW3M3F0_9PSEU